MLLPTMGGQTAPQPDHHPAGRQRRARPVLGSRWIGARPEAIRTAEDRDRFRAAMAEIGLQVPRSGFAHSPDEAMAIATEIGFPVMVRPSFILGGLGTGIAHDGPTFDRLASAKASPRAPVGQILVERSVAGCEGVRARGSCATWRTTAWWSAPSRTSTPWASTPATRSPWPRRRPSPTSSTRRCATTPSPAFGGWGWRPAVRTCSSAGGPRPPATG